MMKFSPFWDIDTDDCKVLPMFQRSLVPLASEWSRKNMLFGRIIGIPYQNRQERQTQTLRERKNEEMNLLFHYIMQPVLPSILFFLD
jgi:hypothetical protein